MKKLIIALAAAATLASPALAHSGHMKRAGNDLRGIQAQAMPANDGNAVYANGQYLGSDPDPQVRLQLLRSEGLWDR
jgi:hypothetical protein